jgi:hypothetical protein
MSIVNAPAKDGGHYKKTGLALAYNVQRCRRFRRSYREGENVAKPKRATARAATTLC